MAARDKNHLLLLNHAQSAFFLFQRQHCERRALTYLEENDESQSGSQDAPVLLGEGVGVRGPWRFPVVLIPETHTPQC